MLCFKDLDTHKILGSKPQMENGIPASATCANKQSFEFNR